MTKQTRLMKLIAGNQVELSKLMKGTATTGGKGAAQSGTHLRLRFQVEGPLLCQLPMQLLRLLLMLLSQEVLGCLNHGSHRMPLSPPFIPPQAPQRGDPSQESFGRISRQWLRTT